MSNGRDGTAGGRTGGEGFRPEDFTSLPTVHHPTLSPSGDRVAYYYDVTGRNELYVQPVDGGERRRVSDGEVPRDAAWHVDWLDERRVLFHRDEAGDEQNDVVAIDVETGKTEVLVEPDAQALLFGVAPDGRYLVNASDEHEQMNHYRYDVETGEATRLTSHNRPVWGGLVSPDAQRIAYVTNESPDLDNRDTYAVAADGSERRRLDVGVEGAECAPADWFPDGERLLVTDDSGDRSRVGVYDLRDDGVEWVTDGAREERAVAVTADERIVTVRTREAAVAPVVYESPGDAGRELDLPEGVAAYGYVPDGDLVTGDGRLLVPHATASEPKTLYVYDLDADGPRAMLEPVYGEFDPDDFVDAAYVTYESGGVPDWCESGESYEIGALLYDAREGRGVYADAADLPGVVWVHGGPHVQARKSFSPYVQFLVSAGYTVLQPN